MNRGSRSRHVLKRANRLQYALNRVSRSRHALKRVNRHQYILQRVNSNRRQCKQSALLRRNRTERLNPRLGRSRRAQVNRGVRKEAVVEATQKAAVAAAVATDSAELFFVRLAVARGLFRQFPGDKSDATGGDQSKDNCGKRKDTSHLGMIALQSILGILCGFRRLQAPCLTQCFPQYKFDLRV